MKTPFLLLATAFCCVSPALASTAPATSQAVPSQVMRSDGSAQIDVLGVPGSTRVLIEGASPSRDARGALCPLVQGAITPPYDLHAPRAGNSLTDGDPHVQWLAQNGC